MRRSITTTVGAGRGFAGDGINSLIFVIVIAIIGMAFVNQYAEAIVVPCEQYNQPVCCPQSILPPGMDIVDGITLDDAYGTLVDKTLGATVGAWGMSHANRFMGQTMLVTHVATYVKCDGSNPSGYSAELRISMGDLTTHGDVRPGNRIKTVPFFVPANTQDWMLIEVDPPITMTPGAMWFEIYFGGNGSYAPMGANVANTPAQQNESFVVIHAQQPPGETWYDYDGVPGSGSAAYSGYRALIRPLHLDDVPFTDCQPNGVDDALDIANGTSTDHNGNGIPDECENLAMCPVDFEWGIAAYSGPTARWGHAMAYDRINGRTILFGGANSNETWAFEQGQWTQLSPPVSPPGRTRAEMVYNIDDGVIIMFGGQNSTSFFGDTWVFDVRTDTWTQDNIGIDPPARASHGMSYDSDRHVVVLFGGDDPNYNNLSGTWEGTYDPATKDVSWTMVTSSGPTRSSHDMAYDPILHATILYGGLPDPTETWAYNGSWTQLPAMTNPGSRNGHSLVFNEAMGRIQCYGGNSGDNTGLWEYDWSNFTWVETVSSTPPGNRCELALAYDAANRQTVLFGGTGGSDDTWVYPETSYMKGFAISGTSNGTGWSMGLLGSYWVVIDLNVPGVPIGGDESDFVDRFCEVVRGANCQGLVAAPVRGTDNCFTIMASGSVPFEFGTGPFGSAPGDWWAPWHVNPDIEELDLTGLDCNGNGVDDAIDIYQGTSPDSDDNSVPDECEMEPDCSTMTGDININGLPWEIADAVQFTNAVLYHDADLLPCIGNADINGDCRVDVDDLVLICHIVAGDSAQTDYAGLCFQYEVCLDTSGVCNGCCQIRGDIDHNGIGPDIADLVFLVNYMFGGGEEPPCMEEADLDGNGQGPDIADLVYLINYMFGGGPAPVPCGEGVPWSKLSSVSNEVVIHRTYADGVTTIMLKSDVDIAAVELNLVGQSEAAPVSLLDGEIELFHHYRDGHLKIGLLDMQGEHVVSRGELDLLTIPGNWEVVSASAADPQASLVSASVAKGEAVVPNQFTLDQNYPNPFNPSTEISFSLPEAANVTLDIYNLLGQRVSTPVDEWLEAGRHTVTWDAAAKASGVYFYRIQAGDHVASKKMLLMK